MDNSKSKNDRRQSFFSVDENIRASFNLKSALLFNQGSELEQDAGGCLLRANELPIAESLLERISGRCSLVEGLAPQFLR